MKHFIQLSFLFFVFCLNISVVNGETFPEKKITVSVRGMVCSFCAQGIEKKLKTLQEVKNVEVDLDTKKVVILLNSGHDLDEDVLRQIIKNAGFDVISVEKKGAP